MTARSADADFKQVILQWQDGRILVLPGSYLISTAISAGYDGMITAEFMIICPQDEWGAPRRTKLNLNKPGQLPEPAAQLSAGDVIDGDYEEVE